MKRLSALIFLLLALPATAYAGGWATAGLSSTPEGTKPGGVWKVRLMPHLSRAISADTRAPERWAPRARISSVAA